MLDPVINAITSGFAWIGRMIGFLVAAILWPFVALGRWYRQRGFILRGVVGLVILVWLGAYLWFGWQTQRWTGFDPDYAKVYALSPDGPSPGETAGGDNPAATRLAGTPGQPIAGAPGQPVGSPPEIGTGAAPSVAAVTAQGAPAQPVQQCARSAIAQATADLVDFNVNQNEWVPSMLLSKVGFFGVEWRNTPWFDNKAAFQLGINQVLRRTTIELVDSLGRVRGTSQIDQGLQDARTALSWDETAWYVGWRGPTRPAESVFREAIGHLGAFNDRLARCQALFDARSDNLLQFLDRIAADIGSTSDILRSRLEQSNAGWFDPRADDRFWFAYGQLYAYYGVLTATRADFGSVIRERNLGRIYDTVLEQLRSALNMQPAIVSNGHEASWIMPSHLATMGFYLLRVRSNLVEIRAILDR